MKDNWLVMRLKRIAWLKGIYHAGLRMVNVISMVVQWAVASYNYRIVLRRLRRAYGRRKLRVIFLLSEPSKWKCQRVYDAMLKSSFYDPFVAPTAMDFGFLDASCQPAKVRHCVDFFRRKGVRVLEAASSEAKTVSLNVFRPDIVIYQQPGGIAVNQSPLAVSRYALTFYVPYYMPAYPFPHAQVSSRFHRTLFGNFLEGKDWVDCFRETVPFLWMGSRMYVGGCPLREDISAALEQETKENLVIYAPHWSIPGVAPRGHCYSTFLVTGRPILEFARRHPEIHWVFKPHPVLKDKLIQSGLWSEREVEGYFKEWGQIGEVCDSGDYVRLFARSRAMITDCLSFLSEYLVTNRPLIRLEPVDECWEMKPPAKRKLDGMYRVRDVSELEDVLRRVVVGGEDYMSEKRSVVVRDLGYDNCDVSCQIMECFGRILRSGR